MKNTKKLVSIAFAGAFIFFINCGSKDKQNDSKTMQQKQIPVHEQKLQDYFSEAKPGKWSDLDEKHSPEVKILKTAKEITVTVVSPFVSKSDHYVEAILLTDYMLNEMNKKEFSKTDRSQIKTVFTLPVFSKGEFYILLKCNLHDTWYKKILIH